MEPLPESVPEQPLESTITLPPPTFLTVWDAVIFAGIALIFNIVLGVISVFVAFLYYFLVQHTPSKDTMELAMNAMANGNVVALTTGTFYICMTVVLVVFFKIKKLNPRETLALKPLPDYQIHYLIFISLVLIAFSITISFLYKDMIEETFMSKIFKSGSSIIVFSLFATFLTPTFEEVVFRGFLLNPLLRKWGSWTAGIIITLLFTTIHIPQLLGAWPSLFPILALGIVTAWLRITTGSIISSCIVHTLYNGTLLSFSVISYILHPS